MHILCAWWAPIGCGGDKRGGGLPVDHLDFQAPSDPVLPCQVFASVTDDHMMIMPHILKLVNFDDNWEGRMFYHLILSCPARLLQLPLMTMIMLQDGGDNFNNNQAFVPISIWGWQSDICLQASSLLCLSICLNSGLCSWRWGWRSGWIQKIFYS